MATSEFDYMAIEPSPSTNANNDLDEESWLVLVRQQWQAKGHDRFQELAQDAEAELKRKVAAVPEGERSQPQRDALFQEFMQEMRGIARMQEEEVNALVEEERREIRAYAKSRGASLRGGSVDSRLGGSSPGAGPSNTSGASTSTNANINAVAMSASTSASSSAPPSVDEKLLEEQRRLWDALRSTPYSNAVDDSGSSGSSTEEETEERRRYNSNNRTATYLNTNTTKGHGRARSGTISPPRATDHEQRSKSATVSPAPVYKPELTVGHTIYTPPASSNPNTSSSASAYASQSQPSSHTFFIPPAPSQNTTSTPKAPVTRRRTQSTSSTREIELSKHVITPPSHSSTANSGAIAMTTTAMQTQHYGSYAATQQKHRVWIPPKPPHMVSAEISAANGGANGTTSSSNAASTNKAKDATNSSNTNPSESKQKRPRPVSQISAPSPSVNVLSMTSTSTSTNNSNTNSTSNNSSNAQASTSSSKAISSSQRARSQDPTERKAEKLFGGSSAMTAITTTNGGKHPKSDNAGASTSTSSSSQHHGQHMSNNPNTNASSTSGSGNNGSSSRRGGGGASNSSASASTSAEAPQQLISQQYAVWKPTQQDVSASTSSNTGSSTKHNNEPVPYPPVTSSSSSKASNASNPKSDKSDKGASSTMTNGEAVATGVISPSSSASSGKSDERSSSNRSYKSQSNRAQGSTAYSNSNANMGNSSRSSSVSSRGGTDVDDLAATTDAMAAFWLQATEQDAPSSGSYQTSRNLHSHSHTSYSHTHSHPHTVPSSPPQQRPHLPTVSEVFDQSTIRGSSSSSRQGSSNAPLGSVFSPPVGPSRSHSYSQSYAQDKEDVSKALVPIDMSIWMPPQPQAQATPNPKSSSTTTSTSSSVPSLKSSVSLAPSFTSVSSQSSQTSLQTTSTNSQEGFYNVSDRARSERHRIINAEYKTRAEVVVAFQKKVEDLMKDFVLALERVDSLNGAGKFSYQD